MIQPQAGPGRLPLLAVLGVGALVVIGGALLFAKSSGSGGPAAGSNPPVQTAGASGSAKPSASPGASRAASPEASSLEVVDIDVTGGIGGQVVGGKLKRTRLTVPCVGADPNQVLVMHWQGISQSGVALQGEFDFKPGTWTLGSTTAQGTATIGLQGGKPADSLVGISGTLTTGPNGGSINGTFSQGPGQLVVSGTWTCLVGPGHS